MSPVFLVENSECAYFFTNSNEVEIGEFKQLLIDSIITPDAPPGIRNLPEMAIRLAGVSRTPTDGEAVRMAIYISIPCELQRQTMFDWGRRGIRSRDGFRRSTGRPHYSALNNNNNNNNNNCCRADEIE